MPCSAALHHFARVQDSVYGSWEEVVKSKDVMMWAGICAVVCSQWLSATVSHNHMCCADDPHQPPRYLQGKLALTRSVKKHFHAWVQRFQQTTCTCPVCIR